MTSNQMWQNRLWFEETKVEFSAHNSKIYVSNKNKTVYHLKNIILTVKHGGGCFSSAGPGTLVKVERA